MKQTIKANLKRSKTLSGKFYPHKTGNYSPALRVKCICGKELVIKGKRKFEKRTFYCQKCTPTTFKKGNRPHNRLGKDAWIYPNCETCGKKLKRRRTEVYDRYFCNQKCAGNWKSKNLVGGMIYNWKGGYKPYYGENWRYQRKLCRERDKNTCEECKLTTKILGKNMDVDHKIPFEAFNGNWKKANKLSNLQCLCPSCHSKKTNWQTKFGRLSIKDWKKIIDELY